MIIPNAHEACYKCRKIIQEIYDIRLMYFNNVFKHCKVNSIFQCQVSIQSTCYTAAHMQQVSTSKLSLFHLVR